MTDREVFVLLSSNQPTDRLARWSARNNRALSAYVTSSCALFVQLVVDDPFRAFAWANWLQAKAPNEPLADECLLRVVTCK